MRARDDTGAGGIVTAKDSSWLMSWTINRQPHFKALRRLNAEHPVEQVGAEVRRMMAWLEKK